MAFGAAILGVPASAQVRVVVDGRVQDVPDGVIRTISYEPGGRQRIRDEPFAGAAAPGAATVTTTETTDEDEDGSVVHTTIVTRIEPMVAAAYAPPIEQAIYLTAPSPAFAEAPAHLDVEAEALDAIDPPPSGPETLRIRRDPATGHFITTIRINGVAVRAIVDTGAQGTILSTRDARATGAGKDIVSSQPMAGIGGVTLLNVAHVRSLEVAGQQLGGFTAAIGQDGIPYTLLGQTEIARLGRIVIEDGTMKISPRATRVALR